MYRVAICEDEAPVREENARMCGEILNRLETEYSLQVFSSAESLEEALHSGVVFDLICLDIVMPGKSGLELARELRMHDDRTSILFISSSADFLLDGYSVRPIQYLLKPVDEAVLEKAIADDLRLNHQARAVLIPAGGKTEILPLGEIQYIESRDHGCVFVMEQEERFFCMSLRQAEGLMPGGQFCRCHNSFLIHLDKVVRMDNHNITLTGQKQIPLSRRYNRQFKNQIARYFGSRQ